MKKYFLISLLIILAISIYIQYDSVDSIDREQLIEVEVIRVIDGDTFVVRTGGREERVRLLLIDTPETVHPEKNEEPYGKAASEYSKKALEKQTVWLELDVQERDQYGRILAYVYLEDGSMLNELLLEEGLAQVVVYQPNVKYLDRFRGIQSEARAQKVGIWNEGK